MTTKEQSLNNPLLALMHLPQEEKVARGLLHTPAEILQQPETWENTFARIEAEHGRLNGFLNPILQKAPTVYLVGAGTSDYIGRALTTVLRQMWQCDVVAVPSTELITNMESYVLPSRSYLWISFSRSGDSAEGIGVLQQALARYPQVHHLVISCNRQGKMAQLCAGRDNMCVLLLDDAVNDRGLAMTSSFTNMLIAGHCLAHRRDLKQYRPILDGLISLAEQVIQVGAPITEAVSRLRCTKACFVGTGALAAAATECGLKTLELTAGSISTLAESTMGLRHGPMSALDENTVIVSFVSSDERRRRFELDLLREISQKALGRVRIALVLGESESLRALCDHVIELRACGDVTDDYRVPVDAIVGQMFGLFSSIDLGFTPDSPSPNGTINRVVSNVKIYD